MPRIQPEKVHYPFRGTFERGVGYQDQGAAVTQQTNRATGGVTLNALAGAITTNNASKSAHRRRRGNHA